MTTIVFLVLLACARKHKRRLRLARLRLVAERIGEWTTIGMDGGATRGSRAIEVLNAMSSANEGEGPGLAEVGRLSGTDETDDGEEERPHTLAGRAYAALSVPLRAARDGFLSWAYGGMIHDEAFLREFVARLEAEREAGREDPAQREERVKKAFRELCMVYRLGEEDFAAPTGKGELAKKGDDGIGLDGFGQPELVELEKIKDEVEGANALGSLDELSSAPISAASEGSDLTDPLERIELGITDGGLADEDQAREIKPSTHPAELADSLGNTKAVPPHAAGETYKPINRPPKTDRMHDDPNDEPESGDAAANLPSIQERRESGGSSVYECPLDDYWTLHTDATELMEASGGMPSLFAVDDDKIEAVEASALAASLGRSSGDEDEDSESPGFLYLNAGRRRRAHTSDGVISPTASPSGRDSDDVEISNQCAICLCEYDAEDVIVTSQNPDCKHVSFYF